MAKLNPLLENSVSLLKNGTVLDLGSGDGTNIAYLREKGFAVKGVEKNYGETIEECIKVTGTTWDNIISFFTIHFLTPQVAHETYAWIKDNTAPGGTNILIDFIDEGEWDLSDTNGFYLKKGELHELYADWEILCYEEKSVQTYKGTIQLAGFLVARKK